MRTLSEEAIALRVSFNFSRIPIGTAAWPPGCREGIASCQVRVAMCGDLRPTSHWDVPLTNERERSFLALTESPHRKSQHGKKKSNLCSSEL